MFGRFTHLILLAVEAFHQMIVDEDFPDTFKFPGAYRLLSGDIHSTSLELTVLPEHDGLLTMTFLRVQDISSHFSQNLKNLQNGFVGPTEYFPDLINCILAHKDWFFKITVRY